MKLSREVVLLTMALALLFVANVANAQQYPPVWTDILNQQGEWPPTMASGNYYALGNDSVLYSGVNTDLAGITPNPNTLSMHVTDLPASGGDVPCGKVDNAVSYMESNSGTEITGVGFLGTFNAPAGGVTDLTFYPNQNLFESVFFNEDQCYGNTIGSNSREYGFFLAGSNSSIWAYWGTHENQGYSQVHSQVQLNAANNVLGNGVTIQPGTEYYFEMYPVLGAYGTCAFGIYVYNTSFQLLFAAEPPLTSYGGDMILSDDPGFCTGIASDTGYVSANILAQPQVTGTLPASGLNLNMQRVFVGKN
jgi:hypothetical protein